MPGLFLSLDGLDGCGKSTQCRLLVDWLREQGSTVTACADPGGTPLGAHLRSLLLEHRCAIGVEAEALLFMASRAQLVAEVIRPALDRSDVVVSDRFLLANVVYQGHAGGMDAAQLWEIGLFATGRLEPDLTLVLDLPYEQARARRLSPADRVESRDEAFHQRVREGFLAEARRRSERIRVINAADAIDVIQEQIRREVSRVLETHPRT